MPLIQSASDKARQKNIKELIASGRDPRQATAIAYSVQRKARAKRKFSELIRLGEEIYKFNVLNPNISNISSRKLINIGLKNKKMSVIKKALKNQKVREKMKLPLVIWRNKTHERLQGMAQDLVGESNKLSKRDIRFMRGLK